MHSCAIAYLGPSEISVMKFLQKQLTVKSRHLFSQRNPSQMFDRVLNLTMGRAKYLQQLQMQLSKKSNRAGCYSFSISFYWTAILSKTFQSGKSAKAMMTNSNIKTRYIKIQQTKKPLFVPDQQRAKKRYTVKDLLISCQRRQPS